MTELDTSGATPRDLRGWPSSGPAGEPAKAGASFEASIGGIRRRFVGRAAEITAFEPLLEGGSEVSLLIVHGPVGIGKSWLLRSLAARCADAEVPFTGLETCPSSDELDRLLEVFDDAHGPAKRRVVFCDVNADDTQLDRWARGEVGVPDRTLLVISSRNRPSQRWLLNGSWGTQYRALAVPPLEPDGARELLRRLDVPEEHDAAVTGFSGGSPLLLTLAGHSVIEGPQGPFDPRRAEDALRGLVPMLGIEAGSEDEQIALRVCAMARRTTPGMLRVALGDDRDVDGLFRWLASRSFVDDSSEGLRMQEVARRAVLQETRAHYPDEYLRLHRMLKEHCAEQVGRSIEGQRWLSCVLYLDHHVSELRHYVTWEDDPACRPVEVGKASDWDRIHRAVLEHEGETSARVLKHWAEQSPESIEVVRGPDRSAQGLVVTVPVEGRGGDGLGGLDPALPVAREYLAARADDEVEVWGLLHRFWMDLRHYQSPSPVLTEIITHILARGIGVHEVPFTLAVTRDAQAYLRLTRILQIPGEHGGDFELDGASYSIIAVDWRDTDRSEWLLRFVRRQVDEIGEQWWKRVAFRRRTAYRGTLRDTLRPGSSDGDPASALPTGPGGLGDLIMGRMRRLAEDAELTPRESEVLDLLLLGRSTEEIALVLDISPRTAKFHQSNVLRKLGADSKSDLVRLLL